MHYNEIIKNPLWYVHEATTDSVSVVFFWSQMFLPERVTCFVDGFNLYHSLHSIGKPHLKWLDLKKLFSHLTRSKSQIVTHIYFFSAYPTWKPGSYLRHRHYISALSSTGVIPVMGQFKNKPKECRKCHAHWISHEEKETDVNLALALLDLAYKDQYDHAFVLTRDSDMAPAIHKVKQNFPHKKITILAPYICRHSTELIQAADNHKTITLNHIETSLFPANIYDAGGNLVIRRPVEYDLE